jgi:hypothetical protein
VASVIPLFGGKIHLRQAVEMAAEKRNVRAQTPPISKNRLYLPV